LAEVRKKKNEDTVGEKPVRRVTGFGVFWSEEA